MNKRIVIVGAGFLGLSVARSLRKTLTHAYEIVLLDTKDYFFFTPRLIDALAGENIESVCKTNLHDLAQRDKFTFIHGEVREVHRKEQTISFTKIDHDRSETLSYDILVLCQGTRTNDYGIDGVTKETCPLKS